MYRQKYLSSTVRSHLPEISRFSFLFTSFSVTFGGSILFLLFGVIYFYEAFAISPDVEMSIPISPDSQSIA